MKFELFHINLHRLQHYLMIEIIPTTLSLQKTSLDYSFHFKIELLQLSEAFLQRNSYQIQAIQFMN